MRKIFGSLIVALLLTWTSISIAAEADLYVVSPATIGSQWQPVSAANPLQITGTVTSSSASTVGIAPVVAGSAVSSSVLKAAPGNLYGAYANCTSACWLMIFNATAAPSNGATTSGIGSGNMQDCIPIPAGGIGAVSYRPGPPEVFSVGITAAISSSACGTLTLSTVGFINGSVQ
jgi:hypothetical protein